jgi:DNA/RNA-binding domain of Phe-tRNA-synthetase-like protein
VEAAAVSEATASASEPTRGWCEREVEEELPGLRLVHLPATVAHTGRGSPPAVKARLRELSNRWAGPHAVNLRQRAVPAAYRVFFRHIGLDPDVVRTPIEEAMLARMFQGGFHSHHLLADALLIALVDTGVPVWALDAAALDGPLGIRASREGERLGAPGARALDPGGSPDAALLPAGQLVVADARSAVAVLFGEIASSHLPASGAGAVELFTLQVPGVSSLHVEEALWMCHAMLEGPW